VQDGCCLRRPSERAGQAHVRRDPQPFNARGRTPEATLAARGQWSQRIVWPALAITQRGNGVTHQQ
jgi:hypothetical protein